MSSTQLAGYQANDYSVFAGLPVQSYAGQSEGLLSKQIAGTVSLTKDSTTVTGSGTFFLKDLAVGAAFRAGNQKFTVAAIASNTSLTASDAATNSLVGASVEVDFPVFRFLSGNDRILASIDASGQFIQHSNVVELAATATLVPHQIKNSVIRVTNAGATTLTFPAAVDIVAAIHDAQVGMSWEVLLVNAAGSSNVVALAAGAGNTIAPASVSVDIGYSALLRFTILSSTAVLISLIGGIADDS